MRPDAHERLRADFAVLRARREADTLPFRPMLDAATARARTPRPAAGPRRITRVPAVAVAALALLVAIAFVRQERASARAAVAVAARSAPLVAWRSPTASLLEAPYAEFLRAAPALRASVITVPTNDSGGLQ